MAVLSPVPQTQPDEDTEWQEERVKILEKAKKLGIRINIPLKRPRPMKDLGIYPTTAPDGRTDIKTIELVRGGRDY